MFCKNDKSESKPIIVQPAMIPYYKGIPQRKLIENNEICYLFMLDMKMTNVPKMSVPCTPKRVGIVCQMTESSQVSDL
jgi:hypothetical protein